MTLSEFEGDGSPLEIQVPKLPESLWFVPTAEHAADLVREGVSRGRVWTAAELRDLLSIPGLTKDRVRSIARVKADFEGTLTEVRRSADGTKF